MRKYIYSDKKCALNVSLFLPTFSIPTFLTAYEETKRVERVDADVVQCSTKAGLPKRITHFSCETKGNYSPACLRPSLDAWWQTLEWAPELLQAANRVGGTLRWIFWDWCCRSKHHTLPFSAFLRGVGRGCVKSRSTPCFCVAELQLDWIDKSGYASTSGGEIPHHDTLGQLQQWEVYCWLPRTDNTQTKMRRLFLEGIMG